MDDFFSTTIQSFRYRHRIKCSYAHCQIKNWPIKKSPSFIQQNSLPCSTFKWVDALGTIKNHMLTKKIVCFHSRGRFWGLFIEFVRFCKNNSCAEMGLRVLKMVPSQLSRWILMQQLENPHKHTSSNWAISIKSQKNLPFLPFLLILDDFQIFAKVPYFWKKFSEKYASEIAMPTWQTISEKTYTRWCCYQHFTEVIMKDR